MTREKQTEIIGVKVTARDKETLKKLAHENYMTLSKLVKVAIEEKTGIKLV